MTIYQQLLWEQKPMTIFETGTYTGASALWLSDTLKSYGMMTTKIYSIDIDDSYWDPFVKQDKNVILKKVDVQNIEEAFPDELLKTCPHPWFITEDCHVDLGGVLSHFHKFMQPGDYVIVEETSPDGPALGGQGLLDNGYQRYGNEKMNVLK